MSDPVTPREALRDLLARMVAAYEHAANCRECGEMSVKHCADMEGENSEAAKALAAYADATAALAHPTPPPAGVCEGCGEPLSEHCPEMGCSGGREVGAAELYRRWQAAERDRDYWQTKAGCTCKTDPDGACAYHETLPAPLPEKQSQATPPQEEVGALKGPLRDREVELAREIVKAMPQTLHDFYIDPHRMVSLLANTLADYRRELAAPTPGDNRG